MTATHPDTWLAADQSWLAHQPGMTPWPDGCDRLARQLDCWANEHAAALGATCADPAGLCRAALWECWKHHWQKAGASAVKAIDGWGVAADRATTLGDVVFARCLARCPQEPDNALILKFQAEYMPRLARTCEPGAGYQGQDMPVWWPKLLADLVGNKESPGKLLKYSGWDRLHSWLVKAGKYAAKDAKRLPKALKDGPDDLDWRADPNAPEAGLGGMADECFELLTRQTADVFRTLTGDERLLVRDVFVDKKKGTEIAKRIGRDEGTVTRRKERLCDKLNKDLPAAYWGTPESGDCARLLFGGNAPFDLGRLMTEALNTVGEA